jgi:hypothetical protein
MSFQQLDTLLNEEEPLPYQVIRILVDRNKEATLSCHEPFTKILKKYLWKLSERVIKLKEGVQPLPSIEDLIILRNEVRLYAHEQELKCLEDYASAHNLSDPILRISNPKVIRNLFGYVEQYTRETYAKK